MSNRCKHSEYWPKKKKIHTHIKKKKNCTENMNQIRFPGSRGENTAVQESYGNQVKHFLWNIHEQYKYNKVSLQSKLFCNYQI